MLPFHLGLRHNRHMVSLMKLDNQRQQVLGVAYPDDSSRRARIMEQWGINARSPRSAETASINMPLPPRAQTILSYQVNSGMRDLLNGGLPTLNQSRLDNQSGIKERMHLGTHMHGMHVESLPIGRQTQGAPGLLSATSPRRAAHGRIG